jgi:hypothetical protein
MIINQQKAIIPNFKTNYYLKNIKKETVSCF